MSGICNEQTYDLQKAHDHEIELMKAEQKHLSELFSQTAEALASAIDAKDRYTHGHSTRVAEYSREIARRSGKSEKEVNEIFFAALLHDVGKIGVNEAMTSKRSHRQERLNRLTAYAPIPPSTPST